MLSYSLYFSPFLSRFLPAFTAIRATVGAWVACSTSSSSPSPSCCCYCCVCYIIICKHLSIMQQQREQQQQQQQCLAGYLQRPEDAPGEATRGKQPQQRPTGHINFPHRPQHTHTRQGALDAPLEACEQKGAHSRGVRFGRRLSASGQHLIRRRGRCNAGGRWHSRCTAARCTLRSIIKLLRDLLTSRKAKQ